MTDKVTYWAVPVFLHTPKKTPKADRKGGEIIALYNIHVINFKHFLFNESGSNLILNADPKLLAAHLGQEQKYNMSNILYLIYFMSLF